MKVLSLIGPTGVGKTEISLHLARVLQAQIISVDSMQVYRGLEIGTGKPSAADRREIPHHGLDLAEPEEEFDVLRYTQHVVPVLQELIRKEIWVILAGGSGHYFRVLRGGLCPAPARDPAARDRWVAEGLARGAPALHDRLRRVDSPVAAKIHPNDLRRIVRALEVFEASGRPLSSWQEETAPWIPGLESCPVIGLTCDRQRLYERLEQRVDRWLADGWLEEARRLHRRALSRTAREALGYKELFDHLGGRTDAAAARALIVRNTRRYAKRQWSWFRHEPGVEWRDLSDLSPQQAAERILSEVPAWNR